MAGLSTLKHGGGLTPWVFPDRLWVEPAGLFGSGVFLGTPQSETDHR